jgi:hypothetical protein
MFTGPWISWVERWPHKDLGSLPPNLLLGVPIGWSQLATIGQSPHQHSPAKAPPESRRESRVDFKKQWKGSSISTLNGSRYLSRAGACLRIFLPFGTFFSFLTFPQYSLQLQYGLGTSAMCQRYPGKPHVTLNSNYINYRSLPLHGNSHEGKNSASPVCHYLLSTCLCV